MLMTMVGGKAVYRDPSWEGKGLLKLVVIKMESIDAN